MWRDSVRGREAREERNLRVLSLFAPPPCCCTIAMSLGPCNLGDTAEAGGPKWSNKGCEDWSKVMANSVSPKAYSGWPSNVQGRDSREARKLVVMEWGGGGYCRHQLAMLGGMGRVRESWIRFIGAHEGQCPGKALE